MPLEAPSQSGHGKGMENDSKKFLQDAQTSFRLASSAETIEQVQRMSEIGLDYLRLAHETAEIMTKGR
jgi:hypothetical protein